MIWNLRYVQTFFSVQAQRHFVDLSVDQPKALRVDNSLQCYKGTFEALDAKEHFKYHSDNSDKNVKFCKQIYNPSMSNCCQIGL